MRFGAVLGLGLTVGALLAAGCAAGNNTSNAGGSGGQGATGGAGGNTGGSGATGADGGAGPGGGGQGGFQACTKFTAEAEQAPAAMLFVLDRSASMGGSGKWGATQLAVVGAIDKDVFDSVSLGLVTFPLGFVNPPACLCDDLCGDCGPQECKQVLQLVGASSQGVACGTSALPEVPISPAGLKSYEADENGNNNGVRKKIAEFLGNPMNGPLTADPLDASPIYDAMVAGYNALQLSPLDRRILVLMTDGGFSCTSVASPPRAGILDGFQCGDWEFPKTVNELIIQRRTDAEKPIFTFVIGVPGSNSTGQPVDGYDTPPYNMLGALSSYAVNGSPDTIDPACSKSETFDPGQPAPALPCHFDLSSGAAFNSNALANAIQTIKGKALGCVYDLPTPPAGEALDLTLVNVETTIDTITTTVPKRSNPADDCLSDGCWDYNAGNQVMLLGKTCDDITKAQSAKVDIKVGCETIVK